MNTKNDKYGDELTLGKRFWEMQYRTGRTGWDMGRVSPPIKEYVDQLTDKTIDILIPGAGHAYEAEYLLEKGFKSITIVDISTFLISKLEEKFKNRPEIRLVADDFFEFTGSFDLIIEQTFFCAIDPGFRERYVNKMAELLKYNGKLVGLLFDREFPPGPPFGGTKKEYEPIFERLFTIHTMERSYNSHPARQGSELWINLQKK